MLSTFKEAARGGKERGRPPSLAEINMTLSTALRVYRQTVEREMRYILRSEMYLVTFHFQEIVPIVGHCDIEDYLIYRYVIFILQNVKMLKVVVACDNIVIQWLYKRDTLPKRTNQMQPSSEWDGWMPP